MLLIALTMTIVLAGDSTTVGTVSQDGRPRLAYWRTEDVLHQALYHLPSGHRLRGARVLNLGVGGSTSRDWGGWPSSIYCDLYRKLPIVARACARSTSLAAQIRAVARRQVDFVVLMIGVNDPIYGLEPAEGAAYVAAAIAAAAPARVLVLPPLWPESDDRQAYVLALAEEESRLGILSGPMPVLNRSDAVHGTDGTAVALAGVYLDALLAAETR